MLGTRHEEYEQFNEDLPFRLNANLKRTNFLRSKENNWHENIEIQVCTQGNGNVLLDGKKYLFSKNDVVVINSNVLHYTETNTELLYDCLIISTDFCKRVGINPNTVCIAPYIKNNQIVDLLSMIKETYFDKSITSRIARLNKLILEILIELTENYSVNTNPISLKTEKFKTVKAAIHYIRNNYSQKITLDDISKFALCDKYALCKDFKKLTGKTIIEYLNNYRCIKAIDYLSSGLSVTDTASFCGFDNLSFFTKTFKKYIGKLPSDYKN